MGKCHSRTTSHCQKQRLQCQPSDICCDASKHKESQETKYKITLKAETTDDDFFSENTSDDKREESGVTNTPTHDPLNLIYLKIEEEDH